MKLKVRKGHKLNITFEGGEKLQLKPGFYLHIRGDQSATLKGHNCYKCQVRNIHSDVMHHFNETGYFLANRKVLARIISSEVVDIF